MDDIYILEVSGESCANCYSLMPVASALAAERNLSFRHLEAAEENAEEVKRLSIERVPTLLVMRGDKEIARCTGYQPEEILAVWLDAKIEEANQYGEK